MTTHGIHKNISCLLLATMLSANVHAALTDISSVPLATYSAPTSTDVKPNLMFILDDSGSMDWDYMPDWANDNSPPEYLSKNNAFNGVAYSPAVTYNPPVSSYTQNTDLSYNILYYPSMDGMTTAKGADGTSKPNWKAVPNDGFGIQSTATSNLEGNAYSWTTVSNEYCNTPHLRSCQSGTSGAYTYLAKLRWCNSTALTTCQAVWSSTYNKWRTPSPRKATITVGGSTTTATSVSSITVDGVQILSATAPSNLGVAAPTTSSSTLATAIRDAINACTLSITGSCGISGYSATVSGSVVTISAPGIPTSTLASITKTGTLTVTPTAFVAGAVPGENLRTNIVSTTNSYPFPGSSPSAKAATRTDCAGTTCTYNEEMTNYANWWAYYHTRMQMMKSASSRAFSALNDRFRVGYMSINNNTGSDFRNISDFNLAQRNAWNTKLVSANPNNSTPLREALSKAGRLYSGRLNGTTLNGSTVVDPLQYSCQQNYTILSTDGFWNGNSGYKLDGSTAVGNQDGLLPRPYNDGASATVQQSTSTLQHRTGTLQSSTSTLQQQISQLQTQTSALQQQISQLQASTSALQTQTTQLQATQQRFRKCTANGSPSWGTCTDLTFDCTAGTGDLAKPYCRAGTSSVSGVSSCTVGSTTNPATIACNSVVTSPYASTTSNCTATTTPNSSGNTTQCQYAAPVLTGVSSCTTATASSGPTYTVHPARSCATVITSNYANAGSCTATSTPDSSGFTTQCRYVDGAWANASSCTAVAKSTAPNYTVGTSRQCQYVVSTPYANASSCTATSTPDGSGQTTQCQYTAWTTPVTGPCTDVAQSTTSPYTVGVATACSATGWSGWSNVSSCTATVTNQCQYTTWSAFNNVTSCADLPQSTGPNYTVDVASQCLATASGGNADTLADVAAYYYNTDLRSPTAIAGQTTGTCTGPIISPATTANDLCANNVPKNGLDTATTQHMTTFTLGLGAPGSMLFSPTYWSDSLGDFHDILQGNTANTSDGTCAWQTNGTKCNWPTPASDSVNNIDDLWHAAINGQGDYFSATNPDSLASSLSNMLKKIVNIPMPGTASAAASSNPNISSSDNYVFSSSYESVDWYGELYQQTIDVDTFALSAPIWSAMRQLDCLLAPAWVASHTYASGDTFTHSSSCYVVVNGYTSGTTFDATVLTVPNIDTASSFLLTTATPTGGRKVYTKGSSGLVTFAWANLTATQQNYFLTPAINGLSQFCASGASCLNATDQGLAAGSNLVAFLAGDRTNEGTYYRSRKHVLGDIVSSEARYVKTPLFSYNDTGYTDFKALMATRNPTVYVAANDGMLHAFNSVTGVERWGYIPSMILPKMYKLADKDYANRHEFFVDDSPEVGDICPNAPSSTCTGGQWRTIIVGGLNSGGKGYYALDVTDPDNPVSLWEFTDSTLGYTYGNPRITKLQDGTWVVLLTSGYNNPDGVGRLYVLNASTGNLIRTISTTSSPTPGTAANPSGLARISAHVTLPALNNTVEQVYGGDLNGDLWRFDVNNSLGAGYTAQLLTSFKDTAGNAQPITAKPVVSTYNYVPLILVGTGRYLGTSDVGSATKTSYRQSFYAVVDRLGTNTGALYGNPRTSSNGFVQQTLTDTTCPPKSTLCQSGDVVRTVTNLPVNLKTGNGWFIDFLTLGERSSTDPSLGLGTLVFSTITPNEASTAVCGTDTGSASLSFLYQMNYLTGSSIKGTEGAIGVSLGNGIATRPVLVEINQKLVTLTRVSGGSNSIPDGVKAGSTGVGAGSGANTQSGSGVFQPPNLGKTTRVSWHELVTEQ